MGLIRMGLLLLSAVILSKFMVISLWSTPQVDMPTECPPCVTCSLFEFAKTHQIELIWFGIALLFVLAAVVICTAACRKPRRVLNPAVPKVLDVIVHICEGYQHAGDPAVKEMTGQIISQTHILSDLLDVKLKSV
jgi:hypothetical protein